MSTVLTFVDKKLLESPVAGPVRPDGAIHYTTSTTRGLWGRKTTTVTAASGLTGVIDWRDKVFVIDGESRKVKDLESKAHRKVRQWSWGGSPYVLQYHNSHKELLATPLCGGPGVRFATYRSRVFHASEPAAVSFPAKMHDERERLFLLLMALPHTETMRKDKNGQWWYLWLFLVTSHNATGQ